MGKFSRYKPGDAPVFRADSINAWQDVAQWYSESRVSGKGGQALGGPNIAPAIILVEASDFTTFGAVLTPTGPSANDPATNPIESSRRPAITAGTPESEDDGIVIVFDPAIHNGTGDPGFAKAVASGVATVAVMVTDESHRYARPEPGNSEYLVSARTGPAWLMLPPVAATEPVYTLVLLGPPVSAPRKYPLGNPCLVRDGTSGEIVGIAQRWVLPDGTVECVVTGVCDGCGADDIPDDPPPPVTFNTIVVELLIAGGGTSIRDITVSGGVDGDVTQSTDGAGRTTFLMPDGTYTVTLDDVFGGETVSWALTVGAVDSGSGAVTDPFAVSGGATVICQFSIVSPPPPPPPAPPPAPPPPAPPPPAPPPGPP